MLLLLAFSFITHNKMVNISVAPTEPPSHLFSLVGWKKMQNKWNEPRMRFWKSFCFQPCDGFRCSYIFLTNPSSSILIDILSSESKSANVCLGEFRKSNSNCIYVSSFAAIEYMKFLHQFLEFERATSSSDTPTTSSEH